MHARRYFVKALEAGDTRAALPIAAYKKLYEIEEAIRDREPDERLAVRQKESRPVFDELIAWARIHQPFEAPSSKLGEAIRYCSIITSHSGGFSRRAIKRWTPSQIISRQEKFILGLPFRALPASSPGPGWAAGRPA